MANYGNARSNEKDLLVEVRWIRPTKLCAIFDLFLAILAYIIALVAGKWVFDCKDESYYVSLHAQCYSIEKARDLINIACNAHVVPILNNRGDSGLSDPSGVANGPECQKSSEFEVQLAQLPENEVVFNCVDISEKLPWTNAPMENTSHHFWTIMLLVVALVGCVICFLVALGVYFRGSKDGENSDRNTSIFKIIGLVLLCMGVLSLASVIIFGLGFPAAVPYPSDWKFTWGYGFAFAACILTFIAGILFFFGTTWKKTGYSKQRTFRLW